MTPRNIHKLLGLLSFFLPLALYINTMAPTVSLWDCGEFIATSVTLGVPHPPGTPLYLLLGNVFSHIPLFTDVGARVNLMSPIASALSVMLLYKITVILIQEFREDSHDWADVFIVYISSFIGAMTFAVTDSHWFNAVEAEVYSISTLCTALVVWLILLWTKRTGEQSNVRYILIIAYVVGLATGIHLLNILTLPCIALIIYFKKFRFSMAGLTATVLVTLVAFVTIYLGIIKGTPQIVAKYESILPIIVILFFIILSAWFCIKQGWHILSTVLASILLVYVGYSTFTTIFIRATQHPNINENNPDNFESAVSYMNRDQYGSWEILNPESTLKRDECRYWPRWTTSRVKENFIDAREPYIDSNKNGKFDEGEDFTDSNKNGQWDKKKNGEFDEGEDFTDSNKNGQWDPGEYYIDINENGKFDRGENFTDSNKNGQWDEGITKSVEWNFFWNYQIKEMYLRYFAWQFIGRGHDNWEVKTLATNNTPSQIIDEIDGVDFNRYGLPLAFLIGLVGMLFHFKLDWKRALAILSLFLATGLMIVLYLNQYDPQPRERDYSFVGSFFAFSIWIGIGLSHIQMKIDTWLDNFEIGNFISIGLTGILFICMPLAMLNVDYEEHSRRGNYVAWDYAYNMLNSCEPNAIIFTNGDNDTFPLWYLQEVEKIRTDVRVVNLSLLNTPWYIEQLKNQEPKLKIKIKDKLIDQVNYLTATKHVLSRYSDIWETLRNNLNQYTIENTGQPYSIMKFGMPIDWGPLDMSLETDANELKFNFTISPTLSGDSGFYLKVQDFMILELIKRNFDSRPIYFAVTVSPDNRVGLEKYLQMEGQVFKVTEKENLSYKSSDPSQHNAIKINFDKMLQNITMAPNPDNIIRTAEDYSREIKSGGGMYRYTNFDKIHFHNETIDKFISNYRLSFLRLLYEAQTNENIDEKRGYDLLVQMDSYFPPEIIRNDFDFETHIAKEYYLYGDKEQFISRSKMLLEWDNVDEYKKIELAAILESFDIYDPSIDLFESLFKKYPLDKGIMERLLELYSKSEQLDKAMNLLDEWEKVNILDDTLEKKKEMIERELSNTSTSDS